MYDIYKHLFEYGLTKRGEVRKRLTKFSERRLSKFLGLYMELAQKQALVAPRNRNAVDIFPDRAAHELTFDLVQQLAMYANRIYVHDEVVKLAYLWHDLDSVFNHLRHNTRAERVEYFLDKLAHEVETLLELRPFVEAGIVYLTPSDIPVPKREPMTSSLEDIFTSDGPAKEWPEIPTTFQAYCNAHLKVYPARYDARGNPFPLEKPLSLSSPRNMIAISFEDDPFLMFYHLFEHDIYHEGLDDGSLEIISHFDIHGRSSVDPSLFRHWVEGSKRQFFIERMKYLQNDWYLASQAKSRFITNLASSRDLMLLSLGGDVSLNTLDTLGAFLRMELPFFENASPEAVVKARRNEAAFEEFRLALDKAFGEIESLSNTAEFQREVDLITREVLLVPTLKIEEQMKTLKRNLFINSVLVTGSLIGTIVTQGNPPLLAAPLLGIVAAIQAHKENKVLEDEIRQSPSFFYWEVTQKKK